MWKFFVFGTIVQIVLLIAMLDVYIYQEVKEDYFSVFGWNFKRYQEPYQLTIFLADGLQITDELSQALDGWHMLRLVESTDNESASFNNSKSSFGQEADQQYSPSIFDGKNVFYVGAHTVDEIFNMTSWHAEYITCGSASPNTSEPLTKNATHNDRVVQTFKNFLDSPELQYHQVRFVRFDASNCDPNSSSVASGKRSVLQILDEVHKSLETVNAVMMNRSSMFVTTSSLRVLSRHVRPYEKQNHFLAVWLPEGIPDPDHRKESISYNEAFMLLKTVINMELIRVIKHDITFTLPTGRLDQNNLTTSPLQAEGNLLGFFGMESPEVLKTPPGFQSTFAKLPRLAILNEVFALLDYSNSEMDAVVIVASTLLFCSWISLLVVKAVNLGSDVEEYGKLPSVTITRMLNVGFLVLLVFVWAMMAYWDYPIRYTVYLFAAILTTRWLLDALLLLAKNTSTIFMPSPTKMLLLVTVTLVVVELTFWTARYGHMYILFTTLIAIRILMEAFSTANLRTEISLAISACTVGLAIIIRALKFRPIITVNVAAICWIVSGGLAIKFLMKRLNFERIVMALCLAEYLICTLISNLIFLSSLYNSTDGTMVAILCTLMVINLALPTVGNPANRQCRLLQVSVITASFFLFFSPDCEGLILLTIFATCLCVYQLENASQSSNNDDFILSPFMVLLYSVTLAMASQSIVPIGGSYLFQSDSLVAMGVSCNIVAVIVVYYMKLGFLMNLLQMTVLSCVKKFLETSTLLLIVVVFNLVSLRTLFHVVIFPWATGLKNIYLIHISMHSLAALMFYLHPFIQMLGDGSLLSLCRPQNAIPIQRPCNSIYQDEDKYTPISSKNH